MDRFPKEGDPVRITMQIDKDLEANNDKVGKVLWRDGEYIMVELDKSKVQVECYLCELEEV